MPRTPTVDLVDAPCGHRRGASRSTAERDFERGARSRAALEETPSRTAARRRPARCGRCSPGEISATELAKKVRLSVSTYISISEAERMRAPAHGGKGDQGNDAPILFVRVSAGRRSLVFHRTRRPDTWPICHGAQRRQGGTRAMGEGPRCKVRSSKNRARWKSASLPASITIGLTTVQSSALRCSASNSRANHPSAADRLARVLAGCGKS